MNLSQIVAELYTADGEPPDLEYRDAALAIDVASPNWAELVRLVNEAQNALVTWVHQDGRRMRMRLNEDVARLTASRLVRTAASYTSNLLTLTTDSGAHDTYRGCLVENATGATALVFMSYSTGAADVLMLAEVDGVFAAADTLTISSRAYSFANTATMTPPFSAGAIYTDYTYGAPLEIVGVVSTDGTEVNLVTSAEKLIVRSATSGKPGSYAKSYLGIRFDTYPDAAYEWVVRFMRLPRAFALTDALVESEIPPQFHRAIVLYCFWWLLLRSHETDKAYAVRRNMEDILKRTQTEYDLQDRVQRGQIKLNNEG